MCNLEPETPNGLRLTITLRSRSLLDNNNEHNVMTTTITIPIACHPFRLHRKLVDFLRPMNNLLLPRRCDTATIKPGTLLIQLLTSHLYSTKPNALSHCLQRCLHFLSDETMKVRYVESKEKGVNHAEACDRMPLG